MLLGVITFQNETDPNQRGHRDLSVWSDSRSMVVVSLFRVFDVFHSDNIHMCLMCMVTLPTHKFIAQRMLYL